jgi:uncharacterized protein (DUF433 family)
MSVETRYEHIVLNDNQVPMIAGTTMKVIELVLAHLVYGWSPAELHANFPHLSLGMIHSALAYYWDHQAELDRDMERRRATVEQLQLGLGDSPLIAKLKSRSQS